MTRTPRPPIVARIWLGIFAVWLALLSGVFAHWTGESSPGVLQAFRLNGLLDSRSEQLASLRTDLTRLNSESEGLEKSRVTQHREIRRVLGYAADDEIIFDFGTPDSI